MKRILILGASGTVGSTVFRQLSRNMDFKVFGTYFASVQEDTSSMIRFSVEFPETVFSVLEQVRPDIVISSLRGDFDKQQTVHQNIAEYLAAAGGKAIYISTANVFDASCEKPHDEADARSSDSDYGQFKIACEDLLRNRLGESASVLRIPFVWGKNSPRVREIKAGCEIGCLEVYTGFYSNHVSDMQIAEMIQWIIKEDKSGIFHVGTSDVIEYPRFIECLIGAMKWKKPEFVSLKEPGIMAVLSTRDDIPERLRWDCGRLIRYLCE